MPRVRFLPDDITVAVESGKLIHEAAIKGGVEDLHLPCGGKGTCGKCLVEVVSGHPETLGHSYLDERLEKSRLVMACQTKVTEDLTVRLKKRNDETLRVVGDSHSLVGAEFMPDYANLSPLYRAEKLTIPTATIEEHYSDWQRLVRELTREIGPVAVRTDLSLLRELAETMRADSGKVTVVVQEDDGGIRVVDIHPGHLDMKLLGLAIDIGTTTVAVQVVDLSHGQVLASATSYNGQISRGSDVISRIDYARNAERQAEMRELVLETINELIGKTSWDAQVSTESIHAAFIAGNTTMIHLLLGLPPRHIRETPYVPTVNPVPTLSAGEVGLAINRQAVVACAPGVGSYVGGDITAGLLCTELLTNHDEVFLALDIGTNGEIVLGNADWLVTCACSAGPAFEGSGIKCGMRATTGAIEYIEIGDDGHPVKCDVIGGGQPTGICGSGLICLLGELFVKRVVDQSGRFNMDLGCERLVQLESTRGFVVEWGSNTSDGCDLVITELDIENLMRTKAAIYSACALSLQNVGLDWSAISKVYIAGGFGRHLQIGDAIQIGLLPDLPETQFQYIGNSALTGAYIALLSGARRRELSQIASRMTYIDLSSDPKYMDAYLAAMFLPHTDMRLFPTAAGKLSGTGNP